MLSAVERLRQHAFEVRDKSTTVPKVEPMRSWVKVGRAGERFWCKVQTVSNENLIVVVDNHLTGKHGLSYGDQLTVQQAHVLEVAHLSDMLDFRRIATERGSVVEGALEWRQQRIDSGVGLESNGRPLNIDGSVV